MIFTVIPVYLSAASGYKTGEYRVEEGVAMSGVIEEREIRLGGLRESFHAFH